MNPTRISCRMLWTSPLSFVNNAAAFICNGIPSPGHADESDRPHHLEVRARVQVPGPNTV